MGFSWNDPFGWIGSFLKSLLLGFGLPGALVDVILALLGAVVMVGIVLTTGAIVIIWIVRKVSARIQDRFGPNRVGPFGLLQNVADAVKLVTKEDITPEGADRVVYNLAPLLAISSVVGVWAVVPFAPRLIGADINVGLLYFVSIGGVGTLSVIMAGWASNNKFALLGAFRTVAMLISFEVPMVLALLVPTMLAGSMGMSEIVKQQDPVWYIVLAPVAAFIFFLTSLAEVGYTPFDIVDAESEIVAGYNIEYTGMKFGLFMVSEFLHAFTIAALTAVLFFGGWRGPLAEVYPLLGLVYFLLKVGLIYFLILLIRFTFPRIRIDHMLAMNWKFLTPLALAVVVVTAVVDKLALQAGIPRTTALLVANSALIIVTVWIVRAYARALRKKVEGMEKPEAVQIIGAAQST